MICFVCLFVLFCLFVHLVFFSSAFFDYPKDFFLFFSVFSQLQFCCAFIPYVCFGPAVWYDRKLV